MTRRAGRMTSGKAAKVGVENPITGTWRLNPIGRLVLTLDESTNAA
jgi:hypothetical protein